MIISIWYHNSYTHEQTNKHEFFFIHTISLPHLSHSDHIIYHFPSHHTVHALSEWLGKHGLGKCASQLIESGFTLETLLESTETSLAAAGIKMGTRRQILAAIHAEGLRRERMIGDQKEHLCDVLSNINRILLNMPVSCYHRCSLCYCFFWLALDCEYHCFVITIFQIFLLSFLPSFLWKRDCKPLHHHNLSHSPWLRLHVFPHLFATLHSHHYCVS